MVLLSFNGIGSLQDTASLDTRLSIVGYPFFSEFDFNLLLGLLVSLCSCTK